MSILTATQASVRPLYRIDFTGVANAYGKYTHLERMLKELVLLMRADAKEYEAENIHTWMRGAGGFTRPHTPYYVTLERDEYRDLIAGLRLHMPRLYSRVRYYGRWI